MGTNLCLSHRFNSQWFKRRAPKNLELILSGTSPVSRDTMMDSTKPSIRKTFQTVFNDPFHIKMTDIQKDFNMFAQMAEIMENLSKCHFEESAFDIMTLCSKEPAACMLPKVTENLTKNMF